MNEALSKVSIKEPEKKTPLQIEAEESSALLDKIMKQAEASYKP